MKKAHDKYFFNKNGEWKHHAFLILGHVSAKRTGAIASSISRSDNNEKRYEISKWRNSSGIIDIDLIKKVRARSSVKVATDKLQIIIISGTKFTLPAQNALLKTLEDITSGKIILLLPAATRILPTIYSRVLVIRAEESDNEVLENNSISVDEFLQLSRYDRIKFLTGKDIDRQTLSQMYLAVIAAIVNSETELDVQSAIGKQLVQSLQQTLQGFTREIIAGKYAAEALSLLAPNLLE